MKVHLRSSFLSLCAENTCQAFSSPVLKGVHRFKRIFTCFFLLPLLLTTSCGHKPEAIVGQWEAVALLPNGVEVPFQLLIEKQGKELQGYFVNGHDKTPAQKTTFDGKQLTMEFARFAGHLTATLRGRELTGEVTRRSSSGLITRKFKATKIWQERATPYPQDESGPLTGDWVLEVFDQGERKIWTAWLTQQGEHVRGTVIPVSGDWGEMAGHFKDGKLRLSRFDGVRAVVWEAELDAEGRLVGHFNRQRKVIAYRWEVAEKRPDLKPPDPESYTKVKNPEEPFRFEGIDLDGKTVRWDDPRFRGKVLVVTIMGTWCPNCHDEAPVLNELYRKYRDQGLEVVALAFEYPSTTEQALENLRRFRDLHQIEYTLLYVGTTEEGELERTLPQLVNFGAYPTTIYIGRDGRVRRIHAGFEGPATGIRFERLKARMEQWVKELLAEKTQLALKS